jgi:hypothetical protein
MIATGQEGDRRDVRVTPLAELDALTPALRVVEGHTPMIKTIAEAPLRVSTCTTLRSKRAPRCRRWRRRWWRRHSPVRATDAFENVRALRQRASPKPFADDRPSRCRTRHTRSQPCRESASLAAVQQRGSDTKNMSVRADQATRSGEMCVRVRARARVCVRVCACACAAHGHKTNLQLPKIIGISAISGLAQLQRAPPRSRSLGNGCGMYLRCMCRATASNMLVLMVNTQTVVAIVKWGSSHTSSPSKCKCKQDGAGWHGG